MFLTLLLTMLLVCRTAHEVMIVSHCGVALFQMWSHGRHCLWVVYLLLLGSRSLGTGVMAAPFLISNNNFRAPEYWKKNWTLLNAVIGMVPYKWFIFLWTPHKHNVIINMCSHFYGKTNTFIVRENIKTNCPIAVRIASLSRKLPYTPHSRTPQGAFAPPSQAPNGVKWSCLATANL